MTPTEQWKDNFRARTVTVGFRLGLSRAMCEYLSAVADDVSWNRSFLGSASPSPDNFLATQRSLILRGLIEAKSRTESDKQFHAAPRLSYEWNNFRLTPAGKLVVELLKIAGMFEEADAAISKKARTR